jgi:hypothetical protein
MSRPRESVLAIFDPLLSSSDSGATPTTDKENICPPDFVLLEAAHSDQQPHAPILTKRLVDIGEATILLADEEDLPDSLETIAEVSDHVSSEGEGANKVETDSWEGVHPQTLEDSNLEVESPQASAAPSMPDSCDAVIPTPFRFGILPSSVGPGQMVAPFIEYPSSCEPTEASIDTSPALRHSDSPLSPLRVASDDFHTSKKHVGQEDFEDSPGQLHASFILCNT